MCGNDTQSRALWRHNTSLEKAQEWTDSGKSWSTTVPTVIRGDIVQTRPLGIARTREGERLTTWTLDFSFLAVLFRQISNSFSRTRYWSSQTPSRHSNSHIVHKLADPFDSCLGMKTRNWLCVGLQVAAFRAAGFAGVFWFKGCRAKECGSRVGRPADESASHRLACNESVTHDAITRRMLCHCAGVRNNIDKLTASSMTWCATSLFYRQQCSAMCPHKTIHHPTDHRFPRLFVCRLFAHRSVADGLQKKMKDVTRFKKHPGTVNRWGKKISLLSLGWLSQIESIIINRTHKK